MMVDKVLFYSLVYETELEEYKIFVDKNYNISESMLSRLLQNYFLLAKGVEFIKKIHIFALINAPQSFRLNCFGIIP